MKRMHDSTSTPTVPKLADFSSRHAGDKVGLQVYGQAGRGAARPVVVYFHGGLFNCGTVEDAAALAAALAPEAVIVCVDYPLAPGLHFPATVEVAFEALLWAASKASRLGGDARQLVVAGDQAGGNLAAAVAMVARDRGLDADHAHLAAQVLITPLLDPQQSTPSMQQAPECPCRKAWSDYLGCPSQAGHPYAAPLLSRRLAGLPPALIVSLEESPLRDEAEQYAAKLIAAGVPVQVRRLGPGKGSPANPEHPEFAQLVQTVRQFLADAR
jgi:acetyl esterase